MAKLAAMGPALMAGGSVSMPMLLGSMALSGLGGFLQNREKQQALDRRNEATAAVDADVQQRQEAMRQQSMAALQQLTQQAATDQRLADIDDAIIEREQYITQPSVEPPVGGLPGQERSTPIIVEDAAQRLSEATRNARERLAGLAGLSGYGSNAMAVQNAMARRGTDLGVETGLRSADLAAGEDAKRYYDLELENFRPSPLGGIISGIGQLGSLAAGAGFNPLASGGSRLPPAVFGGGIGGAL